MHIYHMQLMQELQKVANIMTSYLLKLMSGYDAYSEPPLAFRRGNVQRNALASKQEI